ncbi:MAG: penicillin-binding transpeptidase domain-containing protein [Bacteroidales bacterium]|nr:penicillin-binding transpeptidase domain-containing protein [Bacteroidales bacterium]
MEQDLRKRVWVIIGTFIFLIMVYVIQLFYLQIMNDDYQRYAESNAFLNKILHPSRGLIYDRNGKLLVFNQPAYDVMIIMKEVQEFDTLEFCSILGISKKQFDKRIADIKNRRLNPGYSSVVPQLFMNQLTTREYGILQEKLYKFPGFYIQNRTLRQYTYPNGAHVLGSIGEVSRKDIENDSYYTMGDYSGRSGVEKSYEPILRGEKGKEILLRDARGRIKGRYNDGESDVTPVSGKNLTLSIDMELQAYGEALMKNKLGSIVMIDPATGEILCLVSSPTFDPAIMVGRERGKSHALLQKDPLKPLFDRPLMAAYPPGSTFKTAQGLVFQQEEAITAQSSFPCYNGYPPLGGRPACHSHGSPLALSGAIATSCNSYFCYGLRAMLENRKYSSIQESFDVWKDHMVAMGFGYKLGVDLPGEKRGLIPNSKFYNKIYGEKGWRAHTIISIAIGQGEILTTPIQICNLAAGIANQGYFITPHVVKAIQDSTIAPQYREKRYTGIDPSHYKPIVEGMAAAVTGGTCWGAYMPDIAVCGKTGTAQNPHGKDHSIFMGFAPKEQPRVAIAVYVENAGFGATYAVPIGRLMLEKYLRGDIPESSKWIEENMMNAVVLPYGFK